MEDEGPGGRDICIPPFKMPTLNTKTLQPEDSMIDRYHPKMLLFVLDELFYIHSQIKNLQRADEKVILIYEILCISTNQCTDWHLKCLTWAVYDGTLLVGPRPELSGDCPWCMVLAGLHKHIYRGHDDVAHCLPWMLSSWDWQEQMEALW